MPEKVADRIKAQVLSKVILVTILLMLLLPLPPGPLIPFARSTPGSQILLMLTSRGGKRGPMTG